MMGERTSCLTSQSSRTRIGSPASWADDFVSRFTIMDAYSSVRFTSAGDVARASRPCVVSRCRGGAAPRPPSFGGRGVRRHECRLRVPTKPLCRPAVWHATRQGPAQRLSSASGAHPRAARRQRTLGRPLHCDGAWAAPPARRSPRPTAPSPAAAATRRPSPPAGRGARGRRSMRRLPHRRGGSARSSVRRRAHRRRTPSASRPAPQYA